MIITSLRVKDSKFLHSSSKSSSQLYFRNWNSVLFCIQKTNDALYNYARMWIIRKLLYLRISQNTDHMEQWSHINLLQIITHWLTADHSFLWQVSNLSTNDNFLPSWSEFKFINLTLSGKGAIIKQLKLSAIMLS